MLLSDINKFNSTIDDSTIFNIYKIYKYNIKHIKQYAYIKQYS